MNERVSVCRRFILSVLNLSPENLRFREREQTTLDGAGARLILRLDDSSRKTAPNVSKLKSGVVPHPRSPVLRVHGTVPRLGGLLFGRTKRVSEGVDRPVPTIVDGSPPKQKVKNFSTDVRSVLDRPWTTVCVSLSLLCRFGVRTELSQ